MKKRKTINLKLNEKYISLTKNIFNGRRLGNMMFVYSALLLVSNLTNRKPVLPPYVDQNWIDSIFDIEIPVLNEKRFYKDGGFVEIKRNDTHSNFNNFIDKINKDLINEQVILIEGYFQSLDFVLPHQNFLRKKFNFRNKTKDLVNSYKNKILSLYNKKSIITIGFHQRVGDFLFSDDDAFTIATDVYMEKAVKFLMNDTSRQYILFATSDDLDWVRETVKNKYLNKIKNLHIYYSPSYSIQFDMCLASSNNLTLISTGTFSWWIGWLSNTTVVYFENYPKYILGFPINNKSVYYPKDWILVMLND